MGPPKSISFFGEEEEQGTLTLQNGAPEKAEGFLGIRRSKEALSKMGPPKKPEAFLGKGQSKTACGCFCRQAETEHSILCSDRVVTPTRIELVLPP